MSSKTHIFLTNRKQIMLVFVGFLRTAFPYFFSMAWPYVIFVFFGKYIWGECVDTLLIVHLISLILGWGTKKHLLKKFDLLPGKITNSWLENIHSRALLWLPFFFLILISPFSAMMKTGVVLMFTGKFTCESYEPLIEYRAKYTKAIFAETIGFATGFSLVMIRMDAVNFEWIILSMGIGELFRALTLVVSIREIKYRFSIRYINLNFFIQAYPFFMMGFATLLMFIADRVFVYISFGNITKAEYQVFMNFLIFSISVPNLLLIPFFKNYYKSRIKINQRLQTNIILFGIFLTPVVIYTVRILCQYVYFIELPFSFISAGMLYIFPTFVYSPYMLKLMNKNKHLNIAGVTLIAAASSALACSYLVTVKGVGGAVIGAAIGQWILMMMILIVDFQIRSEKKIKLIK